MPLYDRYELYRPALTPAQLQRIQEAEAESQRLAAEKPGIRVIGGYQCADGFLEDPLALAYVHIAREQALQQLQHLPVMPEDGDVSFRFPELDPMGKYSLIDMKIAHRTHLIRNAVPNRMPEVRRHAEELYTAIQELPIYLQLQEKMRQTAQEHRILTRAQKLCASAEGREVLHIRIRELEGCLAVKTIDRLLQGVEFALGLRTAKDGLPEEVRKLYVELGLPMPIPAEPKLVYPEVIRITFQDFDNLMFQRWHANPKHWSSQPVPEKNMIYQPDDVYAAVQYYAMTTVSCALRPVFAHARSIGMHPTDLVTIDGVSLRTSLQEGGFSGLSAHHVDELATAAIAGALLSGRKVLALLPDEAGELPKEATPISREGYIPNRKKRAIYNAWMRFISQQGLYFANPLASRKQVLVR